METSRESSAPPKETAMKPIEVPIAHEERFAGRLRDATLLELL